MHCLDGLSGWTGVWSGEGDCFRGLINGLVPRLGPRTVIGYVTISVDGCAFRAVKGVARGPVYGLVHSFVIVRVSSIGSWTG
jgi:hypothetical protein